MIFCLHLLVGRGSSGDPADWGARGNLVLNGENRSYGEKTVAMPEGSEGELTFKELSQRLQTDQRGTTILLEHACNHEGSELVR